MPPRFIIELTKHYAGSPKQATGISVSDSGVFDIGGVPTLMLTFINPVRCNAVASISGNVFSWPEQRNCRGPDAIPTCQPFRFLCELFFSLFSLIA